MIQVNRLTVRYGDVPALDNVSLTIEDGECVLVTGPSGCGKSTLARVLSGLIPHAIPAHVEGQVLINGLDPLTGTVPETAQMVGLVYQRPASQLFHLRVEDEVAFGPRNLGLTEDEVQRRVDWALEATRLSELRDQQTAWLSGGQKQCLAIAAVLAMQTKVLVLDEPTSSLDVPNTRRVMETLDWLRREYHLTILLIEHRLAVVAHLAERVIVMEDGRIAADGAASEIFADRGLRARLGMRRPSIEPAVTWGTIIEGNGSHPPEAEPLLELQNVSAGYNGRAVLKDIQLKIYPGEFTAVVGDNGAGKSTLALVAAGLMKPQTGRVRYLGGTRPKPGLDVALLFQDPLDQLFTDSVDEEVAFAARNYDRFDPALQEQILQEADLDMLRNRRPLALSAGQQQRTTLAACLGVRPRLLILDEPTLGQDWGHLQRLMDYLRVLNHQQTTILLISHDYKLIHHYVRRIILIQDGRIERTGKVHSSTAGYMEAEHETNHT